MIAEKRVPNLARRRAWLLKLLQGILNKLDYTDIFSLQNRDERLGCALCIMENRLGASQVFVADFIVRLV